MQPFLGVIWGRVSTTPLIPFVSPGNRDAPAREQTDKQVGDLRLRDDRFYLRYPRCQKLGADQSGSGDAVPGEGVEVVYDDGSNSERAVALAQRADSVVLLVRYSAEDEGEFIAPEGMTELAKGFPAPTDEEFPIAQAMQQPLRGAEHHGGVR